jgi:hypothetical protein
MMRRSLEFAGFLLTTVAVSLGCNQGSQTTTTTTKRTTTTVPETTPAPTSPGARVDVGPHGATATGRTAANGEGVDVNVGEHGGVSVDVEGEPIRERIRERRAAREENLSR